MQDNLLLPESGSVRSVELDVRFSPESYIRVRLEKTPGRGRVCYFVRNGDTAEQGEGLAALLRSTVLPESWRKSGRAAACRRTELSEAVCRSMMTLPSAACLPKH